MSLNQVELSRKLVFNIMKELLERKDEFDLVRIFENLDRYAYTGLEVGNTFTYNGFEYEVEDYSSIEEGYVVAGNKVE